MTACPSRTDEPPVSDGYNQSPNQFSNDLTTNADLNGISNARQRTDDSLSIQNGGPSSAAPDIALAPEPDARPGGSGAVEAAAGSAVHDQQAPGKGPSNSENLVIRECASPSDGPDGGSSGPGRCAPKPLLRRVWNGLLTFAKFIGPGFMVAVAYSTFLLIPCCPLLTGSLRMLT